MILVKMFKYVKYKGNIIFKPTLIVNNNWFIWYIRVGYRGGFNAWGQSQLVRIGPDLNNADISLTDNASNLPVIDEEDDINNRDLFSGN